MKTLQTYDSLRLLDTKTITETKDKDGNQGVFDERGLLFWLPVDGAKSEKPENTQGGE